MTDQAKIDALQEALLDCSNIIAALWKAEESGSGLSVSCARANLEAAQIDADITLGDTKE